MSKIENSENSSIDAFGRTLGPAFEKRLARLTEQRWWHDLLEMWRPAGCDSEDFGLRLAIRNGTMNFYRLGQSVAKVGFARGNSPYLKVHAAYITGKEDTGSHYARLSNSAITCKSKDLGRLTYDGPRTLKEWIKASERHRGDEKTFVDTLMRWNPEIIDLEMGLPGFRLNESDSKVSPRMDLVAIENRDGQNTVVFWEAKMMANGELRCEGDGLPKVGTQLSNYREWMKSETRIEQVADAYRENCRILVAIHSRAREINSTIPELGQLVRSVAERGMPPAIDQCPRLVVCAPTRTANWERHGHAEKLRKAGIQVKLVQKDVGSNYVLAGNA